MSAPALLLAELAKTYNINSNKPFFPVNSMRLYYLLLGHGLSQGDSETLETINKVIPRISAILDARDLALADKKNKANPSSEFEHCRKSLERLLDEVDTPELRQSLQLVFSDIYPIQEALLSSIDQYLKRDELAETDLYATLKIRAMDSVLYASVIDAVVAQHASPEGPSKLHLNPIYWQINVSLQINDLVDAIVYAKQDLASKSATLVEIIKRIDRQDKDLIATVDGIVTHLIKQTKHVPLEAQVQTLIDHYNEILTKVISTAPKKKSV